ncbi:MULTISPECIES: hypothetical protein [unclassified Pseudoxanthomonas]|uniref:hypothetical protein n=1 Tax=unclassified Pseudoxanthomonas TaxID=2645906 RepID=UPI0008E3EA9C|nr:MULTISPECIES: hypothetical protein [unclassified Pseudoxanthomonas]PPJ43120.1 hypothetical protein C0063_07855 [Pseudoxanthomonas sp. KAs_5_3]SFV34243.1 hypothetical protein SAMN05428990_2643 [Pseudoxanthomonas sp. YR558]
MERQEPRFDKDMKGVEFRPRSYRGPSQQSHSQSNEGFAWKIGVAVGVGVLGALLIFNAYERHQARPDVEEAMRVLEQESAKLEHEMQTAVRAAAIPPPRPVAVIHPVPPGYRCAGGTLLYRDGNSWTQITARSNHVYCPGSGVEDCYPVTPRSVGCVTR